MLQGRAWGTEWFIGKGIFVLALDSFMACSLPLGLQPFLMHFFFFRMSHTWCKHLQNWSL